MRGSDSDIFHIQILKKSDLLPCLWSIFICVWWIMVKNYENNYFRDFIVDFAFSQGNSEKNTMPVEKIRTRSNLVRDGCSHFFWLTEMYIYSGKISPPHKNFFSVLPNFFNGELMNSQKIREKVPRPLKASYTLKISRKWLESFFLLTHSYIKSEKMNPPQKSFFSGLLNFFNARFVTNQKILKSLI